MENEEKIEVPASVPEPVMTPAPEAVQVDATPKKKKTMKIIGLVVGILVLLVVLPAIAFVYFLFSSTAGPAKAAESFLTLTAAGDYNGAYEITSTDFKGVATVEGLQLFTESYPVLDEMTSVEFTYRGMSDDVMVVSGTMESATETTPITVQLIKEDGEWKVGFFSLNPEDVPSDEESTIDTTIDTSTTDTTTDTTTE
ncbi:MAG: hypothetical protein WCT24_03245 [Patescibacteria group bacterium]|jgi:hypothetical protein